MKSFSLNINFKINEFLYFLYINLKKKKKYKEIKLSFEWFKQWLEYIRHRYKFSKA